MLGVDVSKEMKMRVNFHYFGKYLLISIIDAVIEVEDAVSRTMCNQHISVRWNPGDAFRLAVCYTITHEHGYAIESHSVNLHAGVAEIMYVWVETIDVGSIMAIIMVSADEYFMGLRQVAEPIEEIKRFRL